MAETGGEAHRSPERRSEVWRHNDAQMCIWHHKEIFRTENRGEEVTIDPKGFVLIPTMDGADLEAVFSGSTHMNVGHWTWMVGPVN